MDRGVSCTVSSLHRSALGLWAGGRVDLDRAETGAVKAAV